MATTDEYTPSTEEIREQYWVATGDARRNSEAWGEFDRWLAVDRAAIRAETRRECAVIVRGNLGRSWVGAETLHDISMSLIAGSAVSPEVSGA